MNLNTNFSNPSIPSFTRDSFEIAEKRDKPIEVATSLKTEEQTITEESSDSSSSLPSKPIQEACIDIMNKQNYEAETVDALSNLITLSLQNPNTYGFEKDKNNLESSVNLAYLGVNVASQTNVVIKAFVETLDSINSVETIDSLSSFLQSTEKLFNAETVVISQARVLLQLSNLPEKTKKIKDCEEQIKSLQKEIKDLKNENPQHPEIEKKENEVIALMKYRKTLVTDCYKDLIKYSLKASSVDAKVVSNLVSKFSSNATTVNCFALLAGVIGGAYHGYKIYDTISLLVDNNKQSNLLLEEMKMNHEILHKPEVNTSIKKVLTLRNKNIDIQYADNGAKTICNALVLSSYSSAFSSGTLLIASKAAAAIAIGVTGAAIGVASAVAGVASGIFLIGGIGIGAAYLGYRKNKDIRMGIKYKLAERKFTKESLKVQDNLRIKNLYNLEMNDAIRDLKRYNLNLNSNNETIQMTQMKTKLNQLNHQIIENEDKEKYFRDLSRLTKTQIKTIDDLIKLPVKTLDDANKSLMKVRITDKNRVNHKLLTDILYYSIGIKKEKIEIRDLQNKIENSKIRIKNLENKIRIIDIKNNKSDALINNIFKNNLNEAKDGLAALKKNYEMQKFASEFGLSLSELDNHFKEIITSIQADENASLKKFFIENHINVALFDIDPTLSIIEYCRKKAA